MSVCHVTVVVCPQRVALQLIRYGEEKKRREEGSLLEMATAGVEDGEEAS